MDVHRYELAASLASLVHEARALTSQWDWRRGAYGHALSLPRAADLHPFARYGYQNYPCTGLLDRAPAMRALFDSLACDKISFRLLRRQKQSAYAWHTDEWKGPGVVRFQVPLISDDTAFLVTTTYRRVEDIQGDRGVLSAESFDRFASENAGHVRRHHLAPGVLHYFDTTYVHTLVNAGDSERLTLSFDLVANDWLRASYPAIAAELGPGHSTPPSPHGLRLTWAWGQSLFHPLRTRLRAHQSARSRT